MKTAGAGGDGFERILDDVLSLQASGSARANRVPVHLDEWGQPADQQPMPFQVASGQELLPAAEPEAARRSGGFLTRLASRFKKPSPIIEAVLEPEQTSQPASPQPPMFGPSSNQSGGPFSRGPF